MRPLLAIEARAEIERFPYKLLYTIEADHVLVIAVAHQKRDPDYWADRLLTPDA